MSADTSRNIVEVLQSNLTCNNKDVGTVDATKSCIVELQGKIKCFQGRIQKYIENNYIEFMPDQNMNQEYIREGEALVLESRHLLVDTNIDANALLCEANVEIVNCMDEFREIALGLHVTHRILKVDDLFQCIEDSNAVKDYMAVLHLIHKLQELVCVSPDEDNEARTFLQCECYSNIKLKYQIQAHHLQQNLLERFETMVQFNAKQYPLNKCVTISVSKEISELQETVYALFQTNFNATELSDFLLENCFKPLIIKPVSIDFDDKDTNFMKLTISFALNELSASLRPSYKQVFERIEMLLQSLANINVYIKAEQHVFSNIGNNIKHQLLALLIDECLMYAIPETMDDFEESTVVEDVLKFEQALADVFLINIETDRALFEFTENFESYFRLQFAQKLIDSAKEIMQKDLQDMITIAEKNSPEEIANNPLLVPNCMVSRSTVELIKLLDRIMLQYTEGDEFRENSYCRVVAAILNLYINEVPCIHDKLLKIIPQQAALLHNNCLYLSLWVAKGANKGIPTPSVLVKILQSTGKKYLDFQMDNQKEILLNILKDMDFTNVDSIGMAPQKLIRQCMRQLDVLHNVWQNVLPETVYNETFYNLLNDFCNEIIRQILDMEDISAKVANELSELIDIVIEKTPLLFKDKHTVVHIPCWSKLKQLKFILLASLLEITEQWCDGAGILTADYSAEEIRHLIRALFQNTDRRATALVKIC